jgi:mono/diheme cytochrome c family protein
VHDSEFKDEIDFRDLMRKPEKLFGYAFFYFLGALMLLGMLYLWNINSVGANAIAPAALKDSSALVQDIPLQSPAVLPPVDVRMAGVSSDSLVDRGREVFRGNCASCHGEEGRGDGPSAATLNPKPRNFHSLVGWTNGSKVSQIYRTLEEGIVKNGMASFSYLAPRDRFALAHFVRTLCPGQPVDSPEEIWALETTYQLSKGKTAAGQIPIKKALQIVVNDGKADADLARELVARILIDNDQGAALLGRYAKNLQKVAAVAIHQRGMFPGLDEFVRSVSSDPALSGFRPAVNRLSAGEWKTMHSYLGLVTTRTRSGG